MLDKSLESASFSLQEATHNPNHRLQSLDRKPISSLKPAFSQWIRSLPMEQRFLAAKIQAPGAQQMARKIFSKGETMHCQTSHEQKGLSTPESRRFCKKYEKIFYESLVFVSDGQDFLDHVCFDYSFLESPERLFDLLMVPCDGFPDRLLGELGATRGLSSKLNGQYKSRQLSSYELFSFLRGQVLANFLDNQGRSQNILRCLEEQKKRKKEFSNNWKFSSQENRLRILLLGRQNLMALHEWMMQQNMPISFTELEKEVEDMMKLEKNEFCNRVFKCKLKKIASPIIYYYQSLYVFWKGELEKGKKKRGKYNRSERDHNSQQKSQCKEGKPQGKKPKKGRKSNSLESSQTNQTDHKKTYVEKKNAMVQANSNDNDLQEMQKTQQTLLIPKIEEEEQISLQNSCLKKDESNPQVQSSMQFYDSPKKSVSSSSTSTKMSSKDSQSQKETIQQTFIKQHIKEASISKLFEELQQISDRISEQANEYHDRRVIAFQRIQFLLQYYSIPIKLFGSCASGIAVRNSDIDIAIDNCIISFMDYLPQNERIKAALQRLEELFQTQPWITELKFIKTAAIPVIKMTINTDIQFLDSSIGDMYFELNRKHNSGIINADITVETKNKSQECSHLGLISTNAINRWIGQISSLHSIIITLKEFFSRMRLNCTYEGGLNTFSMIVLLVAYISHAKLQKEENAALVLERILRFYTEEFNEKEQGIDILNAESGNIYYIKNLVSVEGMQKANKQKADLQMKDPMNQQKNMTRNCYSFPQIKKLFKLILQSCYRRAEIQLQAVVQGQKEPLHCLEADLSRMNKQSFLKRNLFIQLLGSLGTVF